MAISAGAPVLPKKLLKLGANPAYAYSLDVTMRIALGLCRTALSSGLLSLGLVLLVQVRAAAQDEGPRVYLLSPTGLNGISPTYMKLSSDFNFAQSILINGANLDSNIGVLSYMRFFGVDGRFAEIWVAPIWGSVAGTVVVQPRPGVTRTINTPTISGLADPYVAFRIGLVGAPALPPAEFAKHKQGFQLYALVGTYIPIGDYKSTRRLNIGTNRWGFRVGAPMVKPFGKPSRPVSLEVIPSVFFFTDNQEPFGATNLQQKPLFVVESHLSYNFTSKLWASLDARYQNGGETTTDGIPDDNRIRHLGVGGTFGYQVMGKLGLQTTYGAIVVKSDGSRGDMLRIRMTLVF